jgi:hypothetical protein
MPAVVRPDPSMAGTTIASLLRAGMARSHTRPERFHFGCGTMRM